MAQEVSGYMTQDNKFFKTEEEALQHETATNLAEVLVSAGVKNLQAQIGLILGCRDQIIDFLAAHPVQETQEEATEEGEQASGTQYEIDTNTFVGGEGVDGSGADDEDGSVGESDIGHTEEEAEAVQSLPPGVRKPVSNLGRHIQPTPIRKQRPVNGPRSGGGDAPGIRRR